MQELLEKLMSVNEFDLRKSMKTAAAVGLIGGVAMFGADKLASTAPEQSVKTISKSSTEVQLPKELEKSRAVEAVIDMSKIVQIESSNNPHAVNKRTGARGLTQIMKATWEESVRRMGKNWSWSEAFDPDKNLAVGTWYMNTRIPQMLRYYKIEDTAENRLTAYNWGIGNLRYNKWYDAPQETINYLKKYSVR